MSNLEDVAFQWLEDQGEFERANSSEIMFALRMLSRYMRQEEWMFSDAGMEDLFQKLNWR